MAGKLVVRRFDPGDRPAIERLNARLKAGGAEWDIYGEDTGAQPAADRPIHERLFVAAEDDEIRGGIWLREHEFWIAGASEHGGWAKYPVSESLIDGAYRGVPGALVLKLMREQQNLMTLGLGGVTGPFARLVAGMRWKGSAVPFLFRIVKPYRVLRRLPQIRSSRGRALVMDLLAMSGVGWLGHRLGSTLWRVLAGSDTTSYRSRLVTEFGDFADEVWEAARERYGLVARRDARMLRWLYPVEYPHLSRIRVTKHGQEVGWIAVVDVDMAKSVRSRAFADLRVGLLADAFAAPEDAEGVLAAGVRHLVQAGVDLIFTNQFHPAWIKALRRQQFLKGPSNFAFYCAPKMAKRLEDPEVQRRGIYVNRGDCDGPRFW